MRLVGRCQRRDIGYTGIGEEDIECTKSLPHIRSHLPKGIAGKHVGLQRQHVVPDDLARSPECVRLTA